MVRRVVGAALAAALIVAASVFPAASQTQTPTGLIRIASISPFTDKTHPFTVNVQITNQTELALENVSVRISVFGRVLSRSQLREALSGGAPTETIGSFTQTVDGAVQPGEQRSVSIEQPASALLGSIARTGVYPLQITLSHSRGEETVSTGLPYMAFPPRSPLNITWIVPIAAPTVRPLGGVYQQSAIDSLGITELTQQVQAIAAHAGANLTLAVDPSMLDTLHDLADGFDVSGPTESGHQGAGSPIARAAATLLATLARAADGVGELASVPYAPVDLPSLIQRGMFGDALRQITLGRSVTQDILGHSPSLPVLLPPGLAFDEATSNVLSQLGISSAVLDPATLPVQPTEPFQPTLFGPTRPVALRGGLNALLPDAALGARLQSPEQGVLLAQALIAETASSWLELPALGSDRVLVMYAPTRLAPTALSAAIDGLTRSPWIRMLTASQALTILPPEGATLPFPRFVRADRTWLAAARSARDQLTILNEVTATPLPQTADFDRSILAAESNEWAASPSQGKAIARDAGNAIRAILSGIQVGNGSPVTLTSRSGRVPVTIINRNSFPVQVRVRVDSPKLDFPQGTEKIVQVVGTVETVDFNVRARAAGAFPLDVRLETPDGSRLIGRGRVVLRSSAVSAVALLVVGGSTFFLLLAWAQRSRRRTRAAPGTQPSPVPADTA